ncbi:ABC transporter permease [Saccharothrix luteola]|uniref:ABC transporter permease n=1 Tax=Saccharothrix luteola TaxID=2893018 RepID=UPI001E324F8E|nr:ABC transporter permease [Saccharothrix luteola]MCC8251536.1 ABC transporter permease [Saccharothrix luteola]
MIRDNARVLAAAFVSALADLRAIYTWRTWTFAWLSRILCQVAFFAVIGTLLASTERTHYLLVGNAVYIASLVSMFVCASTAWERQTGTLPLLVAAPTSPFTLFVGRSAQWLIDGSVCASIALFVLGPLFGVPLPMPRVLLAIPLIILVAVSTYCFGLVLAGVALRNLELRNLVGNLGGLVLMVICGVQVPSSFWPSPIHEIAQVLPLTHGLQAVRHLLAGAPGGSVLAEAGLELCVAAGWLTLAALTFRQFAESGRRDGSIEFGD